jgi:mRNA-degrading endonuclease YafQ of YafQ-DinJ toxin-antitoxin module
MVNYLNILDLWDVVQHGYISHYDPSNLTMTQKTKKLKSRNDYAVNVILNSVSENITILFGTTEIASEMWETLLNRFEGNTQMKRTKLMGLESEFENFYIQEGESIENMYSRLMHILNEFDEVGESLSNSKIVCKIFRAMIKRPRWESMVSILEAMQGSLGEFTHEEIFTHLLCFEEKLRQNEELTQKLKETTLQTQKSPSHHYLNKTSSSSSSMNDQVITKMFERMLKLEKEHNEERDKKGMTCICFSCHKECHTTHDCFLVFPNKKKQNFERISVMLVISNHVKRKKDERNPLNLALIAEVEENSSMVDVDEIVARNNIINLCTLEILHDIAISKNMKMNSFAPTVQISQEFQLHNQVVPCTTSTWDDSDDDFVQNYEFCVENANNFDDETEIESFLSSLKSPIHDSSFQKEIIERLENKISEFELKVQSYELKL